jgi:hypothetical protein
MVAHACHPSYYKMHKNRRLKSKPVWAKVRPYLQNNHSKKEPELLLKQSTCLASMEL